jgi:hypothetical protein
MNTEIDTDRNKVLKQNIFFSFSSSVFMKTSMLLSLLFSGQKFSEKILALQIFISSLSDATGDAYSLTMANASSNLTELNYDSYIEFIYSFLAKLSVGLIHLFLYSIGVKSTTISIIDIITYSGIIISSVWLILEKRYEDEFKLRDKLNTFITILLIGFLLLAFVVILSGFLSDQL